MEQILENIDELRSSKNLRLHLLSLKEKEFNYFKEKIKNIKKEFLYRSKIHGIYHSEKVALNAYLIGLDQNLDDIDMEILMDAAIYHDIGRINDFEDAFHGLASANNIDKVVNNVIYDDVDNLKILKAIIDYHSQNDKKLRINFENYEIKEEYYDRYVKLAKILKDADALDRKRFVEKCNAALNPKFLRFNISHKLINLSEEINKFYWKIIEERNFSISELEYTESDCLHSIGFDFFRLTSVLDKGILSYKRMQMEQMTFPKNFEGGNSSLWISVVPTSLIDKKGEAFNNFIKRGITFLCDTQTLYKPLDYNRKAEAISKGLPYDKSNYIDELYAFYEIPKNDIIGMFVVKEFAEKDVRDVMYLYNTLHYETLKEKIMYIFKNINYNSLEENIALCNLLNEYKKITDDYEDSDFETRRELSIEMPHKLNSLLIKINDIISNLIYEHYISKLNKNKGDKLQVIEAVVYEFQKSKVPCYYIIEGDEEYIFTLNRRKYTYTKKLPISFDL